MVELIRYPTDADWYEVKRRALVTVGKAEFEPPTDEWKHKILEARHSPIRYLMFSFYIECPYWVSTHLARHIHAQQYIKSQRNDRQNEYDRNAARQDAPVQMILDVNAEELMVIANKRLCNKAAKETRELVKEMCALVEDKCQEFKGLLVPMCEYHGGVCHEMQSCGYANKSTHKVKLMTIDEIREMDGEPAWCDELECWGVVSCEDLGKDKDVPFIVVGNGVYDIEARGLNIYNGKPLRWEGNNGFEAVPVLRG